MSKGVCIYISVAGSVRFLFLTTPGLNQLNCGKEPGSGEAMSDDALDINVLTLCRAPKLE